MTRGLGRWLRGRAAGMATQSASRYAGGKVLRQAAPLLWLRQVVAQKEQGLIVEGGPARGGLTPKGAPGSELTLQFGELLLQVGDPRAMPSSATRSCAAPADTSVVRVPPAPGTASVRHAEATLVRVGSACSSVVLTRHNSSSVTTGGVPPPPPPPHSLRVTSRPGVL